MKHQEERVRKVEIKDRPAIRIPLGPGFPPGRVWPSHTMTHPMPSLIAYFDTIPVANALVVLRAGFLFAASEFSNHRLYQFQGIGDDEDDSIIGCVAPGGWRASPCPSVCTSRRFTQEGGG